MKEKVTIYLAGSVIKGNRSDEKNQQFWDENEIGTFSAAISPAKVVFLNPSERSDDLKDSKSVMGRDLSQVYLSDVVVVDAREKRGLGVGAEMLFAKQNGIPVVTIVPRESHYHKTNFSYLGQFVPDYTHPFVETLSDYVAKDHEDAARWIKEHIILNEKYVSPKNCDFLYSTMQYYFDTQLSKDRPMLKFITDNPDLDKKKAEFINARSLNERKKQFASSQGYGSFWTAASYVVPTAVLSAGITYYFSNRH